MFTFLGQTESNAIDGHTVLHCEFLRTLYRIRIVSRRGNRLARPMVDV